MPILKPPAAPDLGPKGCGLVRVLFGTSSGLAINLMARPELDTNQSPGRLKKGLGLKNGEDLLPTKMHSPRGFVEMRIL